MTSQLSIREDRGIDPAIWSALTSSIFPGAEDQSIALAWDYCKARGLDVMKKPVHIVPMNVKDAKTGRYAYRDVIMPGIAEARITAFRTGEFVGLSEPLFGPMVEMEFGGTKHQVPEWCQITAYRLMHGEKASFPNREFFDEACATTKDGSLNSMWTTRKRGQLAKCAEAGALRKAFPEELGGITTADETLTELRDVTPQTTRAKSKVEALPDFQAPSREKETLPESCSDSDAAPDGGGSTPANPEKKAAEGRQKKDRHLRDGVLRDISKLESASGKTYHLVVFEITDAEGKSRKVEFFTFSESMSERLAGRIGDKLRVEFTQSAKGGFGIEEIHEIEGGEEEVV